MRKWWKNDNTIGCCFCTLALGLASQKRVCSWHQMVTQAGSDWLRSGNFINIMIEYIHHTRRAGAWSPLALRPGVTRHSWFQDQEGPVLSRLDSYSRVYDRRYVMQLNIQHCYWSRMRLINKMVSISSLMEYILHTRSGVPPGPKITFTGSLLVLGPKVTPHFWS